MPTSTATVIANGENRLVELPCSVAEFLFRCGWKPTQVVVEHNGNVLARSCLAETQLNDGDSLEIIQPVAGG